MDGDWPLGDRLRAMMKRRGFSQREAARAAGMNLQNFQWLLAGGRKDGRTWTAQARHVLNAVRALSTDQEHLSEPEAMQLAKVDRSLYRVEDGKVVLDAEENVARLNRSPADAGRRYFDHLWGQLSPKQRSRLLDFMESIVNPQWGVAPDDDEPLQSHYYERPADSDDEDGPDSPLAGGKPGPSDDR